MRTNFRIALALSVLVIAMTAPSAFAALGHGSGCACGANVTIPTTWQIEHSAPWFAAAQAEMQRWNKYVNVFNPTTGDGTAGGGNNKNEILFANVADSSTYWGLDIDSNTFGVTYMNPSTAFGSPGFNACPVPGGTTCGTFSETDVIINSDFANGWTASGPPDFDDANGPAYYGATAVHELGHALGLHHNFNNLSTMNYYEDFACQYISMADATVARAHFPTKVQSVLDFGVFPFSYDPNYNQYDGTEPVTISPTSIGSGGTFSMTNITIENIGTQAASSVSAKVYLSTDSNITTGDYLVGQLNWNTNWGTNTFWDTIVDTDPLSFAVPTSVPAGQYFVGVLLTVNGSADSITYNNGFVAPQKLTISGGGGGTGPCSPGPNTLCMLSNRFRVTLSANNSGTIGAGSANSITEKYGWFSLPTLTGDSANPEMIVKMLDGRPVNGKFWVFYSPLTSLPYTLTVTDTQTGVTVTYPKGGVLAINGGADTGAF